jgi:predicted Fe-S protein YdhL (DUF1289 family)
MTDNTNSPCQSICILTQDPISGTDYCIGCFRTDKEIEQWDDLSDEQRAAINNALQHREEKLK